MTKRMAEECSNGLNIVRKGEFERMNECYSDRIVLKMVD